MESTKGDQDRNRVLDRPLPQQKPAPAGLSALFESDNNTPSRASAIASVSTVTATPAPTSIATRPSENSDRAEIDHPKKKRRKKNNRHRHRRNRRPSFLGPTETQHGEASEVPGIDLVRAAQDESRPSGPTPSFLGQNMSGTSLDSDVLLDHRLVYLLAETLS